MELSDEAKAEIAAAVKILREDGVHIHKSYPAFLKSQEDKPEKPEEKPEDKSTEGQPPPVKEEPTEKPKKKGLWWGDAE